MSIMRLRNKKGFTIVELLIVIVVIGILAAITIVAFSGIQARGRDSARMSAVRGVQRALQLYATINAGFPATAANPGESSWALSTDTLPPTFLSALTSGTPSVISTVPLDPVNSDASRMSYHQWPAGSQGCPASIGKYYIVRMNGFETKDNIAISELGAASECTALSPGSQPSATSAVFFGFYL